MEMREQDGFPAQFSFAETAFPLELTYLWYNHNVDFPDKRTGGHYLPLTRTK